MDYEALEDLISEELVSSTDSRGAHVAGLTSNLFFELNKNHRQIKVFFMSTVQIYTDGNTTLCSYKTIFDIQTTYI